MKTREIELPVQSQVKSPQLLHVLVSFGQAPSVFPAALFCRAILEPQVTRCDAGMEREVEPHIGLLPRIVEINPVIACRRIEPFAHQIGLLVLKSRRYVDAVLDAEESGRA